MYDQPKIILPTWLQQQWAHLLETHRVALPGTELNPLFTQEDNCHSQKRQTDTDLRAPNNYSHTQKKELIKL